MAKKAQAAMEFLMTYGWAILVVLVVIGALAYFGVLNPAKLLPDKCTATAGFTCSDFVMNAGGPTVKLINGMGQSVTISSTTFTHSAGTAITLTAPASGTVWKSGEAITFVASGATFTPGDKGKGTLDIVYYTGGDSTFSHTLSVDISGTVQ